MADKPRVGLIGAGRIGSTLARLLTSQGYEVAIANSRGPDTLGDLEKELGEDGRAATVEEAARFGDLVVVAIPFGRYRELPVDALAGRTVVDAGNYYPQRDGNVADLDDDVTTSSEVVQQHLVNSHVVKAFNAMTSGHLAEYGGSEPRYGIPIAGDDEPAKQAVADLVDRLGFTAVDAGSLAEGRKFQPGTDVYGADLPADDLRDRLNPA